MSMTASFGWTEESTEVIAGARQSGKTFKLLEWAGRDPYRFVVVTHHPDYLRGRFDPARVLRADEAAHGRGRTGRLPRDAEYAVDDAGDLIARMLGVGRVPRLIAVNDNAMSNIVDPDDFD